MLEHLRIKNFKGWEDTGDIRMAPITLLFGANSSGKSSIGQFLLLLKQTIDTPDRTSVLFPGGEASAVQLGSYGEMVFKRDSRKAIEYEYRWSLADEIKFKDPVQDEEFVGDRLHFSGKVSLDNGEGSTLAVDSLEYRLLSGKSPPTLTIGMKRKPGQKKQYSIDAEGYILKRNQGRPWPAPAPVRFYGFPNEVAAYHQNADFVQSLNLRHEHLFQSLFYLGPLRKRAERLYSWNGIIPGSVGYAGENTIAAILGARDRKISLGHKRRLTELKIIIAKKLKDMELIDGFEVLPIVSKRHEYEVRIRTRGSAVSVDLPDVGFGVSQVLPVLVQCFYAPIGSIILIEQPEIHLHPSAQSALADVIIDVVNSKENGEYRKIQLIIETHSEAFLLRLRRRICEGKLKRTDVSAYFANVSTTPAKLDCLDLDLLGNIRNWPKNFFGDQIGDILGHAKASLRRKRRSKLHGEGGL